MKPPVPKSTAIVKQSVAVSFLIGMSLEGFEFMGREPIKDYRPPSRSGSSQSVPVPLWISVQSD
jgi:hypothetical protein